MSAPIENTVTLYPNIVDSDLSLGKKVCILAPGPNGKKHYDQIPDDFSVIVVNKAVLINEVTPDWWVIAHGDSDWFDAADNTYEGIRVYSDGILDSITETARDKSANKIYSFRAESEPLMEEVVMPVKGYIRYGASVSAMAIQMACNYGATEILLCGVDMSGNGYFDNSENQDPNVLHLHGDIWDSVKRLNPLLNYMMTELGIKISSLSETRLNVPMYTKTANDGK